MEVHVVSGKHDEGLAQFMEHVPPAQGSRLFLRTGLGSTFLSCYLHINASEEKRTKVLAFDATKVISATVNVLLDSQSCGLMFLEGWQPREWLTTLVRI